MGQIAHLRITQLFGTTEMGKCVEMIALRLGLNEKYGNVELTIAFQHPFPMIPIFFPHLVHWV